MSKPVWYTYKTARKLPKSDWIRRYWEVAQSWLYGGDRDVVILYERARAVRIRFDQVCSGHYHPMENGVNADEPDSKIPAGAECIVETAWCDQENKFGSCYTCFHCIEKSEKELSYEENVNG